MRDHFKKKGCKVIEETLDFIHITLTPIQRETETEAGAEACLDIGVSVFPQDMCVVCGSFGRGAEGHLLACSQCSQCYHPYCVNSKVSSGPRMYGLQSGSVLLPGPHFCHTVFTIL